MKFEPAPAQLRQEVEVPRQGALPVALRGEPELEPREKSLRASLGLCSLKPLASMDIKYAFPFSVSESDSITIVATCASRTENQSPHPE